MPFPNGSFAPFIPPPQVSNSFQNQYSLHGQSAHTNMVPQQHRAAEQPNYNTEPHKMPQFEKSRYTDLNDREPVNGQNNTTTLDPQPIDVSHNTPNTGILQRPKVNTVVTASSDRTDSVSSYNPPSATPPESGAAAAVSSNGSQTVNATVDEPSKYQGRGPFEMRELAKGALLSLAPHNIRFSDLLAEGINAQLLSQLFEEVGLKITPSTKLKPTSNDGIRTVEPRAAQPVPSKPSPPSSRASDALPSVGVKEAAVVVVSASTATGKSFGQEVSTPLNNALAAIKVADNLPSASPTMERKDVIAAMLAAKMGKPIPRRDSPSAAPLSLPVKITPESTNVSSKAAGPPVQSSVPDPTNLSSPAVVDELSDKVAPKARSKAQTELVRQKMEQLKRESAAKAQAKAAIQDSRSLSQSPSTSRSMSGSVLGLSTHQQASLPPRPVSQDVIMSNTQTPSVNSSTTRQYVSESAPVSSAMFTSAIPGLFMMDSDPEPISVHSPEQVASSAHLATSDHTNVTEPVVSNETTYGAPTQQQGAPGLNALGRRTGISLIPSKRPHAADAFDDEDLPPSKVQDNRTALPRERDSTSSDRYSDEISEGEIMEIEEGSPVSPLPRAPGSRSFPVMSDAAAVRSAASNAASPTTSRQAGANGFRPTDGSLQADNNGQHNVASSKHQLELEAMKKRLAEAEDRKRAKQSAPRLQSPSSPAMNQPLILSSSPVAVSTVSATPVTGGKTQHSPQWNSASHGGAQPLSDTSGSNSPKQSGPIDSVQRAKELREKLLRQRMLKQGLPELDKEVQKTQSRQAEAQARLAHLRREAEKREMEAREARKREQEIMEEVKRLEQQLEMGAKGQQQFSREIETFHLEMSPQVVRTTEDGSTFRPMVKQLPSITTTASKSVLRDTTVESLKSMDKVSELTPEQNSISEYGDTVSESEESARQEYNNRLVRPSAEAALPTAEEEATFLEPALVDESPSDEDGLVSREDSDHHQGNNISPQSVDVSDSDDSPMEVDSETDGSASMSDSGSEDYQPAEPVINAEVQELSDDGDEEYDPMDAPVSNGSHLLHEADQDDYEPSEVVEPFEVQTTPSAPPQAQINSPVSNGTTAESEPEHGDDREHGLELTEANTLTNHQELSPSASHAEDTNNVRMRPILQYYLTQSRFHVHLNPLLPVSPLTRVY
jgi:hypothetical protein